MELNKKYFLIYKLLNSLFTGFSIGMLFTIYQPLSDPSIYSLGGIFLAGSMLVVARYYERLLNINSFFIISIIVELIIFLTIIILIFLKYNLTSALLIYIGYQLTFIFGGYLVRAETLVAKNRSFLGKIDVNKQIGYLIGIFASFIFYKLIEIEFNISDAKEQIYILHYPLLVLQLIIIITLINSFKNYKLF